MSRRFDRWWVSVLGAALIVLAPGCRRGEAPPVPPPRAVLVVAPGVNPVWREQLEDVVAALRVRGRVDPELRPVASPQRVEDALVEVSGADARLVVCLGPECATAVFTVAPVYPTVRYVVVPGQRSARNVAAVSFAVDEAAYVAAAVAPALSEKPRVLVVDGPGCGDDILAALRNGLRVRARGASLELATRAEVEEGSLSLEGVAQAVVCPGAVDGSVARALADAGAFVVVFDPALTRDLEGHPCGVIEADLSEALVRVAVDLQERNEPGSVYAFDVGSGVVGFRFCEPDAVDPAVRQAVAEARDEVVAGIAEIEILDMER